MNLRVKPARPGLIVLDPDSYLPLPADGAEVPATSYWLRRLQDGDVVEISTPAPARRASTHTPRE